MSFKDFFPVFRSSGHCVQWSGTILAILVEGYPKNIPLKLVGNLAFGLVYEDMSFKGFFSSPARKVLMVSYCGRSISVVLRVSHVVRRQQFDLKANFSWSLRPM